jgi:uncharacterized membrane protein
MQDIQTLPLGCPDCAAHMPEDAAFCPGCGRAMHSTLRVQGRVGGLPESVAGALAYLTFIPAILFLLKPPFKQNQFVCFHSMQCLFFWLACAAFAAVLRLAALVLIFVPLLGPLLIALLAVLAAIAAVLIWAVLEVKAFRGEWFRLPVLGDFAATYAEKLSDE